MERFKRDETKCIPACDSYQFHMENLHVRIPHNLLVRNYDSFNFQAISYPFLKYLKENVDYQAQLRKQLHLDEDIAMHSVRDPRT